MERRSLSRSKASRSPATSPTSGGGRDTPSRPRRPDASRKNHTTADDAPWPSVSKKSYNLSYFLGNDRLIDLQEPRNIRASAGSRHRTESSKVNRPVGGFVRSIGKSLHLSRSSGEHEPPASPLHAAVRTSLDDEIPSAESDPRGPPPPVIRGQQKAYRSPTTSQWALSPGRSALDGGGSRSFSKQRPPALDGGGSRSFTSQQAAMLNLQRPALDGGGSRSFSSLRPGSPGNLGSGFGMDVFRKRASSPSVGGGASPLASVSLVGGSPAVGEMVHQFRMVHNRVIQWRYVNARSEAVSHVRWLHAKDTILSARTGLRKLQILVVRKRMHLERKKLVFKVNKIIFQQMQASEGWGVIERQYSTALSGTTDCLLSAVCKVPLIEGAKGDPQSISAELRRGVDLAAIVIMTVNIFLPTAQKRGPLLEELARVVTREKSLLEECFELMRIIAALHLQEQSLKCHKVQLDYDQRWVLSKAAC